MCGTGNAFACTCPGAACTTCGRFTISECRDCSSWHRVCDTCMVENSRKCARCHKSVCMAALEECDICDEMVCTNCMSDAPQACDEPDCEARVTQTCADVTHQVHMCGHCATVEAEYAAPFVGRLVPLGEPAVPYRDYAYHPPTAILATF